MTAISDIYDAIDTKVSTLLPTYTKIPDPYNPESNSTLDLDLGYGVALSTGFNAERVGGCQMSITRNFVVLLANQITASDIDGDARATIEKSMFEDQRTIIREFEKNPTLDDTTDLSYIKYLSDGGIEFVLTENNEARYYLLETTFEALYFEDLT